MLALRIFLWITGIVCLVSVAGIFLTAEQWNSITEYFGVEPLPESPLVHYMINLMCATYGGIGLYFIILGLRPSKYGLLVPFSGLACALLGGLCILFGKNIGMPSKWYLADGLPAIILGVLVFLCWLGAKTPAPKIE